MDIPIEEAKSISYSTNDLKIDNPNLPPIEFNYNTYTGELAEPSLENSPQPPGGMAAFMEWISRNYIFPQAAIDAGVNGKILASFVVDKDGSLIDIRIIRDLKYGTGEEFVRVLTQSPKWTPGTLNGKPVRVGYTMPLNLAMQ